MKTYLGLILIFILAACQSKNTLSTVTILDGERILSLQTEPSTPAAIAATVGLTLGPYDRIALHNSDLPQDFILPAGGNFVLQVHRAHNLTILTPGGQSSLRTSAETVGLALAQAGLQIGTADFVEPPLETPIQSDLTITYQPAREITINADGKIIKIKTSRSSVGQALASAGVGLSGLDRSEPGDQDPIPADGQIKIIRVKETVSLEEKAIPYSKKYVYSPALAVGQQNVIQAGEPGLMVSSVRSHFEDGVLISQVTESKSIVQKPKDSIISLGSQVQIQTLSIPGGQIEYWRAVQMYATSYSPCRSGVSECSNGTASGLPVKQGVVALIPALYNQLAGTRVYIPGYGIAVVGDVGGGFPDGRLWIDLAYTDSDYKSWSGMVTVYFLSPAPANIPAGLN